MIKEFSSLIEMQAAFPDEQTCINHLRAIRWKTGPFCPYCGSAKVYDFSDGKTHKCGEKECRQRFSIKVGTIFQDSKIPLRKWFMAIWMLTAHKKGISSAQLARDLDITQKSSWFMLHRLRFAARTKSFNRPLKGEVEADETFLGGKEKNKHQKRRQWSKGGVVGKTVVFGMLERGGELRTMKVAKLRAKEIQSKIIENVAPGTNLMTDEWRGYDAMGKHYKHHTVNHTMGQYVKNYFNHVNGLEGCWSLFKRQVYGIHHHISEKHVDRYLSEFTWRYNLRAMEDGERVNAFLGRVSGRLTYKALIDDAQV